MATIDIPEKICSHCGNTKWIIEYQSRPSKVNPNYVRKRYRCSVRASERYKRWTVNHPDRASDYSKETNKMRTDSGYWKTEEYKKKQLFRYYKDRDQITDHFVRHRIAHRQPLSQSDIPQDLIELKRKELILTRQLRNHERKDYTLY